jgi:hypothetical protein
MDASSLQRAFKSGCWPSLGSAKKRGAGAKCCCNLMRFHLQLRSFPRLLRVDLSDTVDLDCSIFQHGPALVFPTCIHRSRLISPHTHILWIPTQLGCNTPTLDPAMYRSSSQWDSKMSTSRSIDLAHFLAVCSSLTAQISIYALISLSIVGFVWMLLLRENHWAYTKQTLCIIFQFWTIGITFT